MANKRLFSVLVLILTLALAACAGPPAEPTPTATFTPLPPTATHTPLPTPQPTPTTLTIEKGDYLIYKLEYSLQPDQLFFYDLSTDVHIPLLTNYSIFNFAISINDKIAFSAESGTQGKFDIFILEYPYWENTPINITNTPDLNELPNSWSPGGEYLVISSRADEASSILVWDGVEFFQIHEFKNGKRFGSYETDWSKAGKFAFAEYRNPQSNTDTTEIYVWDGNPSHSPFILSQNPLGEDRHPTWGPDEKLAFSSSKKIDSEYIHNIIVWDGISILNDSDNPAAIEEINSELFDLYTFPAWTNEGILIFNATQKIYQWDGSEILPFDDIEHQNHVSFNWRADGVWISEPLSWEKDQLIIHNQKNEVVLEIEGSQSKWSPEGNLMFCVYDHDENTFTISIWDNLDISEVIKYHGYIFASWRNGEYIYCTNG